MRDCGQRHLAHARSPTKDDRRGSPETIYLRNLPTIPRCASAGGEFMPLSPTSWEDARLKLKDKKTVITGADSGIGRAVAPAFAREGADVLISYLDEHDDTNDKAPRRRGRTQVRAGSRRHIGNQIIVVRS